MGSSIVTDAQTHPRTTTHWRSVCAEKSALRASLRSALRAIKKKSIGIFLRKNTNCFWRRWGGALRTFGSSVICVAWQVLWAVAWVEERSFSKGVHDDMI